MRSMRSRPARVADFIVLNANPLENIANTRRISQVIAARAADQSKGTEQRMDETLRSQAAGHGLRAVPVSCGRRQP